MAPRDETEIREEEDSEDDDEDFAPDDVPVDQEVSDDEEDDDEAGEENENGAAKKTKRKRADADEAEDLGFENSGDEAIVSKGLKRRRKKGAKDAEEDEEDGIRIKTRRQRAAEQAEKKPLASTAEATIDVDALWEKMTKGPIIPPKPSDDSTQNHQRSSNSSADKSHEKDASSNSNDSADASDTIIIKRTYNFAGKVHVEEKAVPRDSAEARLWLQSQGAANPSNVESEKATLKRPLKKLRRSIFEPIPEVVPQRTDLFLGYNMIAAGGMKKAQNAKKLNTVEKSKMDWAGYVDKEGLKDELDVAGKKKGAYMDQQEFLQRVEWKKEEEAREARLKGKK